MPPKLNVQPHFQRDRFAIISNRRNPLTATTEICRYLTFEKFVWLLEKSALFHSRLDQLGDPFEGSVPRKYAQRRDAGEQIGYMPLPEYEGINNIRLMLCSYVACWHASTVESAAMWKLYAREDAGVAIVTTPGLIRAAAEPLKCFCASIQPVDYLDFENDETSVFPGLGYIKRKSFEHEKEVRALIRMDKYPQDVSQIFSTDWVRSLADELPKGVEVKVDLKTLIKAIFVSPLAPDWFFELIQSLTARHGISDRVHRSRLLGVPVY